MGGEFQLPEPIIQRIQSFLTAKQAAQTTILSSSWQKAWLTRPNLDFDETDFNESDYSKTDDFWEFAKKTIQRYEESNLKIESFSLCLKDAWYHRRSSGLANQLIVKALKMGATHLSIRPNDWEFVLSHEVFGAENLVGLSLETCKIDLGMDRKVGCSRLESLNLSDVNIGSDAISKIITSCPLIKNLSLSDIYEFFEEQGVRSVGDGLINLHMLRCLVLDDVKSDTLFFGDLSSKFPSLKDFTLHWICTQERTRMGRQQEIQISSRSLQRLNFAADIVEEHYEFDVPSIRTFTFDVPSIRKFTFKDPIIESLSLKSTSREWESHVSIKDYHSLGTLWFRKLNNFLTELSPSKIHLSLEVHSRMSFDYNVGDFKGLPKPEVENLTIDMEGLPSLTCYALFDAMLRLCRPKFITHYLLPQSNNDFLCEALVQGMREKCWIPSHFMYGLHDVEEVNVQLFDEDVAVWRDLPLKSLLDASTTPKDYKQKTRFQLKWKTVA